MLKKTFSVVSLGCFRNEYDSGVLGKRFLAQGYKFLKQDLDRAFKPCDLLLVNTCGFIDQAKEESLGVIRQALKLKKQKKVKKLIVFGCLVQRYEKELKKHFSQIDELQPVIDFDPAFEKRIELGRRGYDFLKICEGCLNRCSFCAIPLIKGSLSSRPLVEVLKEVSFLDKTKIKELNIIGQDITSWGRDLKPKQDLTVLLEKVLFTAKNISWIRLIYTHPRNFSDPLIDLIAKSKKVCKYIDLPIQHINDRILKVMNRRTSRKNIEALTRNLRKKIPGCVIRSSVIVGFPGESEEEFKELLDFLEEVRFDRLGAFIYSREEGTPAYDLAKQVHPSKKKRRYRQVMSLQQKIAKDCNSRFLGKNLDVLIEEKVSGGFLGRSQYDAPDVDGVVFVKRKGLKLGNIYKIKIVDSYEYDLVGV